MPQRPSRPTNQPPSAPDRRALLEAFKDVVRTEQAKQSHHVSESTPARRPLLWVMGAIVVVLLGVLLLQPAWLFPHAPPETPALREASVRVRMYVEIDRIEQFRNAKGRLPATLMEAGGDTTGLVYSTANDGYTLVGRDNAFSLTYTSTAGISPRDFLGDSYRLIAQRKRP